MSQPPNDPFNPDAWKNQQTPPPNANPGQNPNQNQGNYNQVPPGGYQQVPPQGNPYQQVPPQGNYQQNPYQQVPPGGYQPYGTGQLTHPKASSINTCGILGLIFTFVLSLVGLVLNIVTLSMASGAMRDINANPGMYTEASVRKVKAGRTCSIIGLSIQAFVVLIVVLLIAANS